MSAVRMIPQLFSCSGTVIVLNWKIPFYIRHVLSKSSLLLCADGGTTRLYEYGRDNIPNVVAGDMDSLRIDSDARKYYEQKGTRFVDKSLDQDTTDFEKCLSYITDEYYSKDGGSTTDNVVYVVGALGGRLDHQMGHISTMLKYKHIQMFLLGDSSSATLLHPNVRNVLLRNRQFEDIQGVGLVPIFGNCQSVKTSGLVWNLDGEHTLKMGYRISSSNAFLPGDRVEVTCSSPLLWTTTLINAKE